MISKPQKSGSRLVNESRFSFESGAPGEIRTHNPWVRSPVLYPLSYGRLLGMNRVKLLVGRATGFEPVISCATDRRLRPLGYARRDDILDTTPWLEISQGHGQPDTVSSRLKYVSK